MKILTEKATIIAVEVFLTDRVPEAHLCVSVPGVGLQLFFIHLATKELEENFSEMAKDFKPLSCQGVYAEDLEKIGLVVNGEFFPCDPV